MTTHMTMFFLKDCTLSDPLCLSDIAVPILELQRDYRVIPSHLFDDALRALQNLVSLFHMEARSPVERAEPTCAAVTIYRPGRVAILPRRLVR